MPSFSWSAFTRRVVLSLRLLSRRITQPLARIEKRAVRYLTATPPRRRASRGVGILLFGCMSVVLMGTSQCRSCNDAIIAHGVSPFMEAILDIFSDYGEDAVTSPVRAYTASPKPRFTGSDGSQTGTASFLGNFTAITEPSQTYFMMLRNTDCSLVQFVGSSSLSGSANVASYTTNYERTLHQLASLTTTPDVYARGCVNSSPSLSSRIAVALAKKANGTMVFANVATDGLYSLSLSADLSTIKFNALGGLPYAFALATADVNGDGYGDLVVVNGFGTASPNLSVLLGNGDGTFQNPVTYNIAGNQYAVAATIEDVNGDGKPDIVAVSDDQHISVLLGNGNGTFQSAMSFAAPALPGFTSSAYTPILGLIAADLNGDGKMDVVCSNGLVMLGKGDGTFTAVATPAFPYTSANPSGFGPGLAGGDLNNDGKMDLVLDTGGTIFTWIGKGDGTFTQGQSYASINNSGYVAVTDLDGDGNLDIYSGLANGGMFSGDDSLNAAAYVLMGNGDGTFVGAPQVTGTFNGSNLGDVNGDGIPDLITNALGQSSNPSPTFTVQLGNGKGAFTSVSTITAPASFVATTSALTSPITITNANTVGPTSYAVADINGDGKADLVFVDNGLTAINPGNNQPFTYPSPIYFVALSNGDGTFKPPVPYNFPQLAPASGYDVATTAATVQIADFNHDGKPDLIFTYNEQAGGPGTVPFSQGFAIVMGKGDGTFATTPFLTTTYSSTNPPTNSFVPQILSTTDLNGDGKPDLIVNVPGTTIINFQLQTLLQSYVGNGDGTFKAPTTITLGADVYGLPALADFNKDGKLDLAILAETASGQAELLVSTGNGDGTFGAPTISNLTGGDSIRSASLVAADFDADTKPDLALLDSNDYSGIFYGKGDGTFTSVPASGYIVPKDLVNIAASGPAVAVDLNKDAKPDIVAGNTILINLYGNAPVVTTATTTALTASASTITVGSSITFTATVTPSAGGPPTGTVTFYDGATVLGTGAVNSSGVATYTTTGLSVGAQSFTASYPGDTNFSASTSTAVSVTVNPATVATTTGLTASSTNVFSGTGITFTATVTPASGSTTPSGTVTFLDGSTTLGTGMLNASGVATYSTSSLAVGNHSITASYGGATGTSLIFTASTSTALPVTINTLVVVTSTAIAASSTNAVSGTSITFTATVSPLGGATKPTGTVTFYDGATILGTGTLSNGIATYVTSAFAVGTHSITASYPGATGAFSASTSGALSVTITAVAPDFTISLGATTTTVTHGNTASTSVSITPSGGFTAATNITCTGAPANSLCSASPNPVTPVGLNPVATTVTLQTSVTTGSLAIRGQRYSLAVLPLGLLSGFILFRLPRRRRPALLALVLLAAATVLAASGCGHNAATQSSTTTTAPGTYNLTVTGTAGTTTHATTWTVVVQ
jgi:hypothetical protein